jgi:hypothetical protein
LECGDSRGGDRGGREKRPVERALMIVEKVRTHRTGGSIMIGDERLRGGRRRRRETTEHTCKKSNSP